MYYRPLVLITRVGLLIQNVAALLWGKVLFLPAKQGNTHFLKLHQPKLTLFLSCPLFLVHLSIWLLSFCGSYLYIPLANLLSDTCIADNTFPKTHLLCLVCLRSSFWYMTFLILISFFSVFLWFPVFVSCFNFIHW